MELEIRKEWLIVVLVKRFEVDGESIEIWQYGTDDYEVRYLTGGINYRGPLLDVMYDLHACFEVFSREL
jgi:hypothetical protein